MRKYTSNGIFVTKWGTFGTGPGQFLSPFGVAVNATGDVYVSDTGNHRVDRYIRAPQPDGIISTGPHGAAARN